MERLTLRPDIGLDEIWFANSDDPEGAYTIHDIAKYGRCDVLDAIAERLAAYEDTGLTPEEVLMAKAKERVIDGGLEIFCPECGDAFDLDVFGEDGVFTAKGVCVGCGCGYVSVKDLMELHRGRVETLGPPYARREAEAMANEIVALKAENARLQRERDALLTDLRGDCASCVHRDAGVKSDVCQTCPRPGGAGFGNWEWRGAREDKPRACVENGKE